MRCFNLDDDCMSMEQPAEQPREIVEDIVAVAVPPTPVAAERSSQEQAERVTVANSAATIAEHANNAVAAESLDTTDIAETTTHDVADHAANTINRVEDVAPQRQQPPPSDPRRRLRELLAIPDRDRSDALWDELIELEIQLAPGNRISPAGNEPRQKSSAHGRFAPQGRRPDAGSAPRQNRPYVQGNSAQNGQPGAAQGPGTPVGAPGTARPAKRFFKKVRRTPRPVG